MRAQSGFTLLEVLVVISIMAILCTLASPNFLGWTSGERLKSAAGDIQAAVQLARLTAVKENAIVIIEFDPAAKSYIMFVDNGSGANAGNGVKDLDEPTVRHGAFPGNIELETSFAGNKLSFDGRGFTNASGKGITVKDGSDRERVVEVTVTGSSRIL
jgi:prepilin-type N-terminal cleavage/methylation domain-containing protein